jgi:hypothetical protein
LKRISRLVGLWPLQARMQSPLSYFEQERSYLTQSSHFLSVLCDRTSNMPVITQILQGGPEVDPNSSYIHVLAHTESSDTDRVERAGVPSTLRLMSPVHL